MTGDEKENHGNLFLEIPTARFETRRLPSLDYRAVLLLHATSVGCISSFRSTPTIIIRMVYFSGAVKVSYVIQISFHINYEYLNRSTHR